MKFTQQTLAALTLPVGKTEHIESTYDVGDGSWSANLYKVHIWQ